MDVLKGLTLMEKKIVAYLDIETTPCLAWCFWTGDQYISENNILEEPKIIMASVKYSDSDDIKTFSWDRNQDDKQLLISLSKYLRRAEEVVAYNGANFDCRWITARLVKHGLPHISFKSLNDIMRPIKANLRLLSYKLDYVAKYLGLTGKMATSGPTLWLQVWRDDDREALKVMENYCERDVSVLEAVHLKVMSYIGQTRYTGLNGCECRHCGGENIVTAGKYYRGDNTFQRFKCLDCQEGKEYAGVARVGKKNLGRIKG